MTEQTAIRNPKPAEERDSEIAHPITVEVGLYAVIVAVGLVVRLCRLDEAAPLSTSEAQLALAALRGTTPPTGASPLLYWITALLFAVLSSSDGLARLVPALVGSALVALPASWRGRIGRAGALGAAAILAISPVAITTSRTLSGEVIAAAAVLGLVAVADRYLQTRRRVWLYAGAALLGIGLTSGRSIYSALLTLLIGAGLVAAFSYRDQLSETWRTIRSVRGLLGRWAGVLGIVFVASATALMWRPGGLGAAADLFSAWLTGLQTGATPWYMPLQLLAVYEPLALVAGIIGALVAFQRPDRFAALLLTWLAAAALWIMAYPGRASGDVLLVVIPLAMLGGYAFEALADSLRTKRFRIEEGALTLAILPALALFILGLALYLNSPTKPLVFAEGLDLGPAAQASFTFLALALLGVLMTLFAVLTSAEIAMRGATIAALIVLTTVTWAAGWGAAQINSGDPRELIAGPETTAPAVRSLARDLTAISARTTADPHALAFVVQSSPDGVLAWYLRDLPHARFVDVLDPSSAPSVVVTTAAQPPALSGSYAGQRFTLQHEWRIEGRPANDVLKWLIYRQAESPKPTQQAILWIRQGP